ncbi:MAG: hypothetical protein J6Q13_00100 [Clostridia bacterium]|nr:hypothetical protein [Clostridia bacterium]
MKKKIITFVFILIVAGVSVLAYFMLRPCKEHTDKDGDGYCDRCKELFNVVAVYYHEYGAKGDGVTNDYEAIKKAHEVANRFGAPVYADPHKTYLIGSTSDASGNSSTITIKTDTDWKDCKFIFDDTNVKYEEGENKEYSKNIFTIENDYTIQTHKASSKIVKQLNEMEITTSTKKLNISLGYPALLILYNNTVKHFIRYGGNQNNGSKQHEVILVDKYGNVDPSTPFMFDYDKVTSVDIIRTDVKPITVQNATIETKSSKVNLVDTNRYINRGIMISRSNTTVKNIDHIITGEIARNAVVDRNSNVVSGYKYNSSTGEVINSSNGSIVSDGSLKPFNGHSYHGIIQTTSCNNILVENVTFQGRVKYLEGTYDLTPRLTSNITIKDCDQSNFYYQDKSGDMVPNISHGVWGVSGSNYCKNFVFDGCKLTRYDAHCGVYNAKIINSEIAVVSIIGAGELYIENTKFHRDATSGIIQLRNDYGATFNGKITMKDCEVVLYKNVVPNGIISGGSANHNFGYQTYFPNIEIDNLKFTGLDEGTNLSLVAVADYNADTNPYRSVNDANIHIKDAICVDGKANINPYMPPTKIELKNNSANKYNIMLYDVPFFKDTLIIGNIQRISV